jgi:hypothetical protein
VAYSPSGTPWYGFPWTLIVNAGHCEDARYKTMLNFCHNHFGIVASPRWHLTGNWYHNIPEGPLGQAWFGFKFRGMMEAFQEAFPNLNGRVNCIDRVLTEVEVSRRLAGNIP